MLRRISSVFRILDWKDHKNIHELLSSDPFLVLKTNRISYSSTLVFKIACSFGQPLGCDVIVMYGLSLGDITFGVLCSMLIYVLELPSLSA